MKVTKPFRLMDRVGAVISSGQELAVFDVSNVWRYKTFERGRVRGTDIKVQRVPGEVLWRICTGSDV